MGLSLYLSNIDLIHDSNYENDKCFNFEKFFSFKELKNCIQTYFNEELDNKNTYYLNIDQVEQLCKDFKDKKFIYIKLAYFLKDYFPLFTAILHYARDNQNGMLFINENKINNKNNLYNVLDINTYNELKNYINIFYNNITNLPKQYRTWKLILSSYVWKFHYFLDEKFPIFLKKNILRVYYRHIMLNILENKNKQIDYFTFFIHYYTNRWKMIKRLNHFSTAIYFKKYYDCDDEKIKEIESEELKQFKMYQILIVLSYLLAILFFIVLYCFAGLDKTFNFPFLTSTGNRSLTFLLGGLLGCGIFALQIYSGYASIRVRMVNFVKVLIQEFNENYIKKIKKDDEF